MQFLKPQVDIAQANLKKATTREEQMQAQADMQKFILKIMSACLAESVACRC